jgi:hypothetical protein
MTDTEFLNSIKKILDPNTVNSIKKFVIIQEKNGYRVFEKYIITKYSQGFKVTQLHNDTEHTFLTLKNALTWCTLHNKNKIVEAQRVKFLDTQLNGLSVSTSLLERYVKKTRENDKKFIYLNKIIENKLKHNVLLTEMLILSETAKKYQLNWLGQTSYK